MRLGVGYAAQEGGLFPALTVAENLRLAELNASDRGRKRLAEFRNQFPLIDDKGSQPATNLSGGQQQIVKTLRALASADRLLLLDEPSQGVQPTVAGALIGLVRRTARETQCSVVLAEQAIDFALRTSHRWVLLENGRIEGTGLSTDDGVRRRLQEHLMI